MQSTSATTSPPSNRKKTIRGSLGCACPMKALRPGLSCRSSVRFRPSMLFSLSFILLGRLDALVRVQSWCESRKSCTLSTTYHAFFFFFTFIGLWSLTSWTPTGVGIGLNAALIAIITEWLSDIKMGYCSTGWWLNQKFCCWAIEEEGECMLVGIVRSTEKGTSEVRDIDWAFMEQHPREFSWRNLLHLRTLLQ